MRFERRDVLSNDPVGYDQVMEPGDARPFDPANAGLPGRQPEANI